MKKSLKIIGLWWTIMKVSSLQLVIAFVACTYSYGGETYAQELLRKKVSVNAQQQEIRSILLQLESSAHVKFVYSKQLLPVERKVSIVVTNKTISDVLDQMFHPDNVSYKIVKNRIILQLGAPDTSGGIPRGINTGEQENMTRQTLEKTVKGTVTSGANEALPGVNVAIKGTTRGTTTDKDGNYSLEIPDEGATLVFSFVGYTSQEIKVGTSSVINVDLAYDSKSLEEVVVVGYGTQKAGDVTGSVSSVNASQIRDRPLQGPDEALLGQVAGVQVQMVSGAPGGGINIQVRGTGSITAGTQPLYVIDGFPVASEAFTQNTNPLSTISPNDIASIDVLKDASATAIYGSRGSNGVVIITTKKGTAGKPKFEFETYAGLQQATTYWDLINGKEYADLKIEELKRDRPNEAIPTYWSDAVAKNDKGTDWQRALISDAVIQNYSLRVSAGTDKTQYSVSGGVFSQGGIIPNSSFDRYSLRLNLQTEISKRLKLGASVAPTFTRNSLSQTDGHPSTGVIIQALQTPSLLPVYNADGSYATSISRGEGFGTENYDNPLNKVTNITDKQSGTRMLGNLFLSYRILDGLEFRTEIGADIYATRSKFFYPSTIRPGVDMAYGISRTAESINILNENTLRYDKTLNEAHSISGLLGYTIQKQTSENNYLRATNFPNDLITTLNAGRVTEGNSREAEWSLLSYLARVNYGYKGKYLVTATIRQDGSSRFGANYKWGVFPSTSIGWRLSEEAFMRKLPFVSEAKLRASYGFSGNNSIPNYGSISLLSSDNYVFGTNGGTQVNGLYPNTAPNENISWEKSQQMDLGLDLGLFDNRIFLVADYYNKITSDLLLQVPIPSITGFVTSLQNIGKVRNRGWEFAISTKNLVNTFKWSSDFNISFNRNKVLALGPSGQPLRYNTWFGNTHVTEVGQPIGNFYGFIADGVFMNEEEVAQGPVWAPGTSASSAPGAERFRDLNGDGLITDADDRTTVGNALPSFTYGFTNNFSYKNFDLMVLIQGVQGRDIINQVKRYIGNFRYNQTTKYIYDNHWRSPEEPGNGEIPALSFFRGNTGAFSTSYVEDGSFLSIRNIVLGYTFRKGSLGPLNSGRLYAGVKNPIMFTNYTGYNPDVNERGDNPTALGVDHGGYPLQRVYTIGATISF